MKRMRSSAVCGFAVGAALGSAAAVIMLLAIYLFVLRGWVEFPL